VSVSDFDSGATRAGAFVDDPIAGLARSTDNTLHLWAVNVNEFGRVSHDDLHPTNRRQYNIATWYWEMEDVPARFAETALRPDELWAPSQLVRSAFLGSTNAPILHIHPSIRPMVPAKSRDDVLAPLGISPSTLVVLVSFDARSVANRKNPLGAIEAFRRAFGPDSAEAVLIVKAHSLSDDEVYANKLRAELAAVNGVLIDQPIADQEFTDLLGASDIYLSLHRCEGFGLGMAEAMLLGKPVVATGFSGNRTFMNLGNSCLVGYTVRPLDAADLALHPDQMDAYDLGSLWAEPDLDQAASWLRLLHSDTVRRAEIGERARLSAVQTFDPARTGQVMVNRLWELHDQLNP
ncbi:MAG: glycosyltransferase, partial [Actinomycetota bacterium]